MLNNKANRRAHIRHQCRKTTVLSCHRCLINTGVEKMNYIQIQIRALTTICLQVRVNDGIQTLLRIVVLIVYILIALNHIIRNIVILSVVITSVIVQIVIIPMQPQPPGQIGPPWPPHCVLPTVSFRFVRWREKKIKKSFNLVPPSVEGFAPLLNIFQLIVSKENKRTSEFPFKRE